MDIGIIGEGVTDQVTIENILFGYFNDKNLPVTHLQPKPNESGNWDKVCKYLKSDEFKQAFGFNDLIIVHLDTDFLRTGEVPEEYRLDIKDLDSKGVVLAVREKLIELIGTDFYDENSKRIVFAIAVDSIECWFLPIYYSNQPQKASKESGCLETLNAVLPQREKFYIKNKEEIYYRKISRHFIKNKDLLKYGAANTSFKLFLADLEAKTTELH
ncbi:hypothetical protein GCM10028895_03160 [Pontibacter rugosus]